MKLRIITHHDVHNHGALLQLRALSRILSRYDSTACALDFQKNFDFMPVYAGNKYNISIKSIPYYLGYMVKKGVRRTLFNVRKKSLLSRFKADCKLVGEYYSRAEDVDAVFVGSDEVFSIEHGLNPFFWGMGVPARHVFAYAGCFGPTTAEFIEEKHATEYIEAGIRRFDAISVRDQNSQRIIRQFSGKEVMQVCDPVILYGYAEEMKTFTRPMRDKYLFVYAYDENMNDPAEWKHIRAYAKQHHLKVITAGFYHAWCDKSINVDPIELLCWIRHAECVVTDTFHGTVMALVANVPFATKIRGNRNKLGFLLSEYEAEAREIQGFEDIATILDAPMDFAPINDIIRRKQEQGLAYIADCVNSLGK